MVQRRVSISKLSGDDIASVLRGEVLEITYQDRVDAVLIRRPQNEKEVEEVAEKLRELVEYYVPMTTRRGRPKNS